MAGASRNYTLTFTLAGAFVFMTLLAMYFAAGRAFGYRASTLFVASPWPVIGYLLVVRRAMHSMNADFQTRSRLASLILSAGLLFAGAVSSALLLASLTSIEWQNPFAHPTDDAAPW